MIDFTSLDKFLKDTNYCNVRNKGAYLQQRFAQELDILQSSIGYSLQNKVEKDNQNNITLFEAISSLSPIVMQDSTIITPHELTLWYGEEVANICCNATSAFIGSYGRELIVVGGATTLQINKYSDEDSAFIMNEYIKFLQCSPLICNSPTFSHVYKYVVSSVCIIGLSLLVHRKHSWIRTQYLANLRKVALLYGFAKFFEGLLETVCDFVLDPAYPGSDELPYGTSCHIASNKIVEVWNPIQKPEDLETLEDGHEIFGICCFDHCPHIGIKRKTFTFCEFQLETLFSTSRMIYNQLVDSVRQVDYRTSTAEVLEATFGDKKIGEAVSSYVTRYMLEKQLTVLSADSTYGDFKGRFSAKLLAKKRGHVTRKLRFD